MLAAGLISKIPSFVAVQPEQSSPVVEGIFKKEKIVADKVNTMADAVAVADPFDFYKVYEGIEKTDGLAFTATEDELLKFDERNGSGRKAFTEPACAIHSPVLRTIWKLLKGKKMSICVNGYWFKSAHIVAKYSLSSPVLDPNLGRIKQYIHSGFTELQRKS